MIDVKNDVALKARSEAAKRYRPDRVALLLVAEAPPCTLDRSFYFEDVPTQDSLFRHVYKGVTGKPPTRERKAEHLRELRDAGVFLIDVCEMPIADGAKVRIAADDVAGVVRRATALKPDAVILIKSNVYDEVRGPLVAAGLNVVDVKMPFPGSGQQRKFDEAFAAALAQTPLGNR